MPIMTVTITNLLKTLVSDSFVCFIYIYKRFIYIYIGLGSV